MALPMSSHEAETLLSYQWEKSKHVKKKKELYLLFILGNIELFSGPLFYQTQESCPHLRLGEKRIRRSPTPLSRGRGGGVHW